MECESTIIKLIEYDNQVNILENKIKEKQEEMNRLIELVKKRGLEVIELNKKIKRLKK